MRNQSILWAALVVAFTAVCCAQSRSATVKVSGNVSINGKKVEQSGEIFPNDLLRTHADSAASMTASGTIVSVAHRTQVAWMQNSVELRDCGTVEVATVKQFPAVAHDVTTTPTPATTTQSPVTRYRVQQRDRRVRVEVTQGSVNVVQGQKTTPLTAGQSQLFDNNVRCHEPLAAGWVLGPIWGATTIPIFWQSGHEPLSPKGP